MKLYHGSNIAVKVPQIIERLRALDFGAGFYLTSSREQTEKWAKIVTRRRLSGIATASCYELSDDLSVLQVLKFDSPSGEWLDFVVTNRKKLPLLKIYDLVIGPVANDSTLPVIDDYMDGRYTKEEAVKRLLPQKLTDQYAFLSQKALSLLTFKGSEVLK